MKNNKLIILIVVGILLITGVTIFTLTRNKVAATMNTCTSGHTYVTGTSYEDLKDGTHKKTCTVCGYSTTEEHFDYGKDGIANSGSNGICDKCGATMHIHTWGWVSDKSFADATNHALYCTDSECPNPNEDNSTAHVDEDENGLCDQSGCNEYHRNPETGSAWHKLDEDKAYYKAKTNASGIIVCALYCGDCHYNIEDRPHDWSNCDGICANLCGRVCSDHNTMTRGTCSTCGYVVSCKHVAGPLYYAYNGYHWSICKNCGDPINETKEECSFGWVDGLSTYNSKKHILYCTECKDVDNYISENHTYGNTVIKDELPTCTETGSGKLYCEDECGYYKIVTFDALGHIDENNDGICDRDDCEEELCDHEDGEYNYNDTKHWWECDDCDYEESKELHDKKLSSKSYEATCIEEGKYIYQCKVCDWEKEVTTDPLGHSLSKATCTEPAKCQRTGCTYTEGTALGHKDENNDGKCDKCGNKMSTETPHTHTAKTTYEKDSTYHWKICSDTTCNQIIGTKEAHIDNNQDGKCDTCTYTMSVIVPHTHTAKTTYETDATYHWKICSDTTCNQIIGAKEAHIDNNKDGKCDTCSYTMSTVEPECTHSNKEWKSDENEHWQVCKECEKEISGTRENHTYENGKCECGKVCSHKNTTPKSDDTHHWDECNVCGEKLNNEEHSYKDGECECGKDEDKKECEHTNKEWKADKDEHWQVCKECGKEIEGTRGKHVDVDGKCKNCGLKDSTSSSNTLPNTGRESMQIAVMITLAILGSALLIKLSREE